MRKAAKEDTKELERKEVEGERMHTHYILNSHKASREKIMEIITQVN
jgi:hypothetical protein